MPYRVSSKCVDVRFKQARAGTPEEISESSISANALIFLVAAGRIELPTPSPPGGQCNVA
jgi:hypothetical protein